MGKTKRRQPTSKESKWNRLEREWERQVEEQELEAQRAEEASVQEVLPAVASSAPVLPPGVEAIRQEAEAIINRRLGTDVDKARRAPFSVQSPATDYPQEVGGGVIWWTGANLDTYIPLSDYGSPQRVRELRIFALTAPLILLAEAVLCKKVQALQWTIEGGRNLAAKWQKRLNNFENGDGWDIFIGKLIRSYVEADGPVVVELIRSAPSWAVDENFQLTERGERAIELGHDKSWEIVDARVMDPISVYTTTSTEFPIVFHNPHTGKKYYLRPYQFMSLVDMPTVDDRFPGHGMCAVSRAVWAAQEDRMIIRYAMEKMSENPGAGIVVANVAPNFLRTALNSAKAQRESRGVVFYKGLIFLPVLNPSGTTTLDFLSFAGLPDGFDRSEVYNQLKEIVATAFGLDVLEFGTIPGRLGTATQARVAAQKGRTKTIGAIMQGVERAFRYKLLPESVVFKIKKHDQDEEMQRAQIDEIYFENAIRYAQFAHDPSIVEQYLADKGAIPNEPPYVVDITETEEITDIQRPKPGEEEGQPQVAEAEAIETGPEGSPEDIGPVKMYEYEPRVRIDREGKVTWLDSPYRRLLARKRLERLQPKQETFGVTTGNASRAMRRFTALFPQHAEELRNVAKST